MKKKTTKRALLLSALSLLLCMAMLVGSTFAWFTDSVTSGRNTIVSGQLDVELYYATLDANNEWTDYAPVTASTKVFNENALYEPGYTEVVKFKVVNAGTLALKYSLDAKIYGETAGKNVYGDMFNLSNYLYTGTLAAADYNRAAAVAAATTQLSTGFNMKSTSVLNAGAEEELVLVLTMPTTVGNEANHIDGFQPKIDLGITLVATQATYEADDFNNQYDVDAALPLNLSASAPIAASGATSLNIAAPGTKLPAVTASVPAGAVAAGATSLTLNVQEQANVLEGITVSADQAATTYDIEITGVAEGNTAPIVVTLDIGAGLTNVVLYHNAAPIASTYNPVTGILTFETTGFSPFTVVCDAAETYNVATATELAQAAANIKAGGTIVLTANITVETGVTFEKDVTLDLNGKTLAANVNKGRALKVAAGVNFVLDAEGSNVTFGNGTYGVIEQLAGDNTSITVIKGTFEGTTDFGAFVKLRGGENLSVTLNNVNYTDHCELGNPLNAYVTSTNGMTTTKGLNYVVNGGVYNVPNGFALVGGKLTLNRVTLNVGGAGVEANDADIIGSNITLDPGAYVYSIEGACVIASNTGVINIKDSTLTSSTFAVAFGGVAGTTSTTNNIYMENCTVTAPTINAYPQYGTVHFDAACKVNVTG